MPCDYSKYSKNWKQIRAAILERAGNKCEFCGVPNYSVGYRDRLDGEFEPYAETLEPFATHQEAREFLYEHEVDEPMGRNGEPGLVIVLTVAHLDHDPGNNDHDNLRALCQQCHLRYDSQHHQSNAARTRGNKRLASQPILLDIESPQ